MMFLKSLTRGGSALPWAWLGHSQATLAELEGAIYP